MLVTLSKVNLFYGWEKKKRLKESLLSAFCNVVEAEGFEPSSENYPFLVLHV